MKCEQISSKFVTGLQNPINTSVVRKTGRVTTMTCKLNKKSLKKITALGSMTYLNEKTTGCHLKNSHMALLRVLNTNVKGLKIAPNLEGEMKRTKKHSILSPFPLCKFSYDPFKSVEHKPKPTFANLDRIKIYYLGIEFSFCTRMFID
jgi:hypothetical protein